MVFTFMPRPLTMAIPASTAMSEPGMRWLTRGHNTSTARHTRPTMSASTLKVEKLAATAESLSIVSMVGVPAGYVRPNRSLSWPATMVTAMPAVKPVVMV
ncbi:Uncharacterised protein [Collinsella intestinalis]|nr:Uncharacterised protein [Collinsella intestinalis]